MIHTYAALRGNDEDDLRRSMLAALLANLLFGWPEFAHYHSPAEQLRTTGQLIRRVQEWRTLTA